MRKIQKNTSPAFFETWKRDFMTMNGHQPKYDDFRGLLKTQLRELFIDEQYDLCCYCCKGIDNYSSHIDHTFPRKLDHAYAYALDYYNLVAFYQTPLNGRLSPFCEAIIYCIQGAAARV